MTGTVKYSVKYSVSPRESRSESAKTLAGHQAGPPRPPPRSFWLLLRGADAVEVLRNRQGLRQVLQNVLGEPSANFAPEDLEALPSETRDI